jgi:F0F1-type ATP synthase membrane subunit c/vacuolar-type H+-ATPase subunit K
LVAGVEEFGKHSLHEGVTTQSKDDPIAQLARLLAQREGSRDPVVEPRGPLPLEAGRKGDGSWDRDSVDKFEAHLRSDCAAIETEVKDARPRTTKAASWKAATSNALPNSTDELKAPRHKAKAVGSDPVGVANGGAALQRSLYVRVGRRSHYVRAGVIIVVGLSGLGAGIAFWNNASNLHGASAIKPETELTKRLPLGTTMVDTPAQDAAKVDPSSATPAGDLERSVGASQPRAQASSTIAPRGEGELANQTASAPIPPTATQLQAEPVGISASPEPKKAETLLSAPLTGAFHPSDMLPRATATFLSPQSPAAVAPPSTPKTAARTPKTAKPSVPSVAAKLNDRSSPEQIVKPSKTIAPETVAKPDSTHPPIAETKALAPKPAASPESDEPSASLKSGQEAVDSLAEVVKNWVGMDAASQP